MYVRYYVLACYGNVQNGGAPDSPEELDSEKRYIRSATWLDWWLPTPSTREKKKYKTGVRVADVTERETIEPR